MRVRRSITALGAGAALVIAATSFAWACTTQAWLGSIAPGSGPAGTRATVTGTRFAPGPVEIRWNTNGGPLLATATGPDFDVAVTIPSASPDVYSVIAISRQGNTVLGQASTAFEVTATPSERGGYSSAGPEGDGATGGAGTTASGSTSARGSVAGGAPGAMSDPATSTEQGDGAFPAEATADGQPATGRAGAVPAGSAVAAPTGTSGRSAAVDSAVTRGGASADGTRGSATGSGPMVAGADDTQRDAGPSARTVWGDPASGFEAGGAQRGVSLLDHQGSQGGPSPIALGATALSVGLVALFSGFALAEARRRRVVVADQSS